MKPTLTSEQLEVIGADRVGATWVSQYLDMVSVSVRALSSGNSLSQVKMRVVWGDGVQDTTDLISVGREHTFSHTYELQGEYVIRVFAVNSDGEISTLTPSDTAALRVSQSGKRRQQLRRWGGIALPQAQISQSIRVANETFPVVTANLSAPAQAGTFTVQLVGNPPYQSGTEITIYQEGKRVSYGRVLTTTETSLELDSQLNDSYGEGAVVEVRQSTLSNELDTRVRPSETWNFPTTFDVDLVKASVTMLLTTRPGERLMRPEVGCDIERHLFDQNDPFLNQKLSATVNDSLVVEPRAVIQSISITDSADHQKHISVITALDGSDESPFEAVVPLSIFGA